METGLQYSMMRLQEELLRDNLTRLYGMRDELEKTYRTEIDLVHSRYRGTHESVVSCMITLKLYLN